MSDTPPVIEGEAEEVSSPPIGMPIYPAQVSAFMQAVAGSSSEALRGIRRDPDTNSWWATVERAGGGFVIYGLPAEGGPVEIGAHETMAHAERAADNIATGRAADDQGPPPAPPPPGLYADDPEKRLAHAKERAKTRIDAEAESCRQKYITPGAGQAMEYLATEAEAQQALVLPEGAEVPIGMFPFLDAELMASGGTLQEAAHRVMKAAGQWRHVGGMIKAIRLTAKDAVDRAATEEEVWASVAVTWP